MASGRTLGKDARAAQEPAGSPPATESQPLGPSEVRSLYLDLLRRPPFDAEREALALTPSDSELAPGSVPASDLAAKLLAHPDFWKQWYEEQLYYFLLVDNFTPHAEGLLAIPGELVAGKLHVRDAIHRIALSSSFDQRNPGADTFVTVVMEQIAGLAVEKHRRELEIGKAVYDGKPGSFLGKQGSSQSDVVRAAIEQRSFAETFLAREFARYVHAAPERRALGTWVAAFQADPKVFPSLVAQWLASPEYEARLARRVPMDNRLFVRALLVDLCGREPTPEEYSRMRSALDGLSDPVPLRSVMARLLLDSEETRVPDSREGLEPEEFVRNQFLRLLGREPSAAEAATFVEGLVDPAGSPKMIVYALIAHPEYQSY